MDYTRTENGQILRAWWQVLRRIAFALHVTGAVYWAFDWRVEFSGNSAELLNEHPAEPKYQRTDLPSIWTGRASLCITAEWDYQSRYGTKKRGQ